MYCKYPNSYFVNIEERYDLDIIIENEVMMDLSRSLEDEVDEEYIQEEILMKNKQ